MAKKKNAKSAPLSIVSMSPFQKIIMDSVLDGIKDIEKVKPDGIQVMVKIDYKKKDLEVVVKYVHKDKFEKAGLVVFK